MQKFSLDTSSVHTGSLWDQCEPVGDKTRITSISLGNAICTDLGTQGKQVSCGRQRTEEDASKVVCMGFRRVVGDKKRKSSFCFPLTTQGWPGTEDTGRIHYPLRADTSYPCLVSNWFTSFSETTDRNWWVALECPVQTRIFHELPAPFQFLAYPLTWKMEVTYSYKTLVEFHHIT
jgi:hypothetical protein